MHSNSSRPFSPPGRSAAPEERVGAIFDRVDNDPQSIQSARPKNCGKWDEARKIDYEIFQEHLRALGADHVRTLSFGYDVAEIELESGYVNKAKPHGRDLCQQGKYQESESVCANVLARQQMNIGEEHFDTLDTRRRLGMAYNCLSPRENAVVTAQNLTESLKRLLGDNHVRIFAAALDTLEYVIYNHTESSVYLSISLQPDLQQALEMLPGVHQELLDALGRGYPLTIRALSLHGRGLTRAQ
ncbi:uncharacterized protein N7477_007196 [Penicillium maclennaniae]|uniref:uncharacterized protein n=1 Tax=Penicillium maclennaniae TaxID=1343394 RepID=UPI0025415FAE|nr:uncharacterized protein N7477_007196 [Penicillium maclennaniae]KAJ5668626.1 hypothetical protein N7477_007196 [Penicillium maclennaniae]